MRKRDELTDPRSCMSKARDDEWTFVLLGRDSAAPAAVRAWVEERIRLGKNKREDAQIVEALAWCDEVRVEQARDERDVPDLADAELEARCARVKEAVFSESETSEPVATAAFFLPSDLGDCQFFVHAVATPDNVTILWATDERAEVESLFVNTRRAVEALRRCCEYALSIGGEGANASARPA